MMNKACLLNKTNLEKICNRQNLNIFLFLSSKNLLQNWLNFSKKKNFLEHTIVFYELKL